MRIKKMQEMMVKSEKAFRHLRLTKFIDISRENEKKIGDVKIVDGREKKIGEGFIMVNLEKPKRRLTKLKW